MLLTGIGTYTYLGAHQSVVRRPAKAPSEVKLPAPTPESLLSGTLYVAQGGALYSLAGGQFKELTAAAGWVQPQALPGGTALVAANRDGTYADSYHLAADGQVIAKLTDSAAP